MEVKCRFCGNKIDKKIAFKVKHGKTNWYYCSEEHATQLSEKDRVVGLVFEIIGPTTNTMFYKELNEISKVHSLKKMISYLESEKSNLEFYMNKEFVSEFAKIRYFFAILRNKLGDYEEPKEIIKKEIEVEVFENTKMVKESSGLDSLLDMII